MSWIVETLLLNREKIRSSHNLEDDYYNNLLILEKKVEEMVNDCAFSDIELIILHFLLNKSITNNLYKTKDFKSLCNKIAKYSGGFFTDDGYVYYIVNKHRFNHKQEKQIRKYLKSRRMDNDK
jgi:hypothetical protein